MQIVVLAAFALTLTAAELTGDPGAPALAEPSWALAAAVAVYLLLAATLTALAARIVVRGATGLAEPPPRVLKRRNVLGALISLTLVSGSVLLMALGLAKWLRPLGNWPLAREAALMAPFTAGVLIVWLLEYPAYAVLRRSALARQAAAAGLFYKNFGRLWSRGEYIAYNTRHYILFIAAPAGLILLTHDLLWLYLRPVLGQGPVADYALQGAMMLAGAGAFIIAPTLIVHVWRTAPLGDGALRSGLEEIGRRIGFRARGIRVWLTGGAIANAAVMGLLAPVRYVLLSDALLEQMDVRQVESVFAHEAGHVVSHHIFYSVLFGAASILFCAAGAEGVLAAAMAAFRASGWTAAVEWAKADSVGEIVFLTLLAAMWAVGFGWISRRFERQSDVIAAWAMGREEEGGMGGGEEGRTGGLEDGRTRAAGCVGQEEEGMDIQSSVGSSSPPPFLPSSPLMSSKCPASQSPLPDRISPEGAALFARSLERVAELNGIPYRNHNWRHGAVAWRVGYIIWLGSTGGSRREIDRVVRRIKIGLWMALATGIVIIALQDPEVRNWLIALAGGS